MNKKILLVDANLLLFKSFYGTFYTKLTNKTGTPTSAINAFFNSLFNIINYVDPDYLYLAFDSEEKTERHKLYANYKEGRKKAPEELWVQFDWIKKILKSLNIVYENVPGYEADDLIATIAKRYCDENQIFIFSDDKDLLQLVDKNVSVISKKRQEITEWNYLNFFVNEDLFPKQIIDFKALAGDSSDNIKGVPGIGEVSAKKLLNKYSNIDSIYRHIDDFSLPMQQKLLEAKEQVYLFREIIKLNSQAKTNYDLDSIRLRISTSKETFEILDFLELKRIKGILEIY
ncbi:5'-3' exonuclease [Mesomycoplasma molare]|uniref:5'-3' exonuclease n=1 Tax=Mesomycoplasma molare TaxID=171288 RepID=A0ABY5TX47_9BACT|nr:5'-3' exonuclease [Mesomycoplasma molare]UWD34101.1 5'-3' exonuclease [Mesomycoplasma molare]